LYYILYGPLSLTVSLTHPLISNNFRFTAKDIADAIREARPGIIVNFTTGTIGNKGAFGGGDLGPTGGPIACMEAGMPEIAALNSGSLNYLKSTSKNTWAWEPLMFENPVSKIQTMIEAMDRLNIKAECECFDTGIVRSIKMFEQVNMLKQPINVSLVMGVASGMPCKPEWVPLLKEELNEETQWQVIAIGRDDSTWPTLRKAAELGGHVRTGNVVVDLLPAFLLH
jgi:3-keto-5-aminohexanoate cleavage enzyme